MSAYWLFLSLVAIAYAAWLSFRVYRAFLRLPRKSTLDIDGDGLANEIDPMPRHCDGDFFGVAKPLPAGANANAYYWLDRIYVCPIAASYTPNPTISYADSCYSPSITILEPELVATPEVAWEGCHAFGDVGQSTLVTTNYIGPMTVSFQGIMVLEIPCCETNVPTRYFATENFTGFMTHDVDAGAGLARRIQTRNRWTVDHAGGGLYRNWSAGRLTWNIPVGWARLQSDMDEARLFASLEYDNYTNTNSRPLLIGGRTDVYLQTFLIDENGTARIDKFGHWLSRSRHCRIILDGETKQWTHPIW